MINAREILGILGGPLTPERILDAFRDTAKQVHPDRGGTSAEFETAVRARDYLLEICPRKSGKKFRLESEFQAHVVKILRARPKTVVFNVHGGPMQETGFPDLLVWNPGIGSIGIELKMFGARPRLNQVVKMEALESAGCPCFVVSCHEEKIAVTKPRGSHLWDARSVEELVATLLQPTKF